MIPAREVLIVFPQDRASDMRLLDDILHGLHLLHEVGHGVPERTTPPTELALDDGTVLDTIRALLAASTTCDRIVHLENVNLCHRAWRLARRARGDQRFREWALASGEELLATPRSALRAWSGTTLIEIPPTHPDAVTSALASIVTTAEYSGSNPAALLLDAAAEVQRSFGEARSWAEARRGRGRG